MTDPTPPRQATRPRAQRILGATAVAFVLIVVPYTIGLTAWNSARHRPNRTLQQLGAIHQQVIVFKVKRKRLPDSLGEVYEDPDEVPIDHWGTPFRLVNTLLDPGYDIASAGPDATFGTTDDLAWSSVQPRDEGRSGSLAAP